MMHINKKRQRKAYVNRVQVQLAAYFLSASQQYDSCLFHLRHKKNPGGVFLNLFIRFEMK